jgi:hypothetical protein
MVTGLPNLRARLLQERFLEAHRPILDARPPVLEQLRGAEPSWSAEEPEARRNLANSFAPVALFDKDYDDLGIAPLMKGELPELAAAAMADRALVLYKDEWRDTTVTVEVEIRIGDTVYTRGTRTIEFQLGERIDIPCSSRVPCVDGIPLEMVLRTYKSGVMRFEEAKLFRVAPTRPAQTTSEMVSLGEPVGSGWPAAE